MRRLDLLGACVVGLSVAAGCGVSSDDTGDGDEADLTSLSARQRALTFEGVVYVKPDANDSLILDTARKQTQTAFGALLASKVSVRTREVQNIDTSSLRKRKVTVVDTNVANDPGTPMLEVRYVLHDDAVVPVELARHSGLSLALLAKGADAHRDVVVPVCTKNDKEAKDDAAMGLLWYDFDPGRAACRKAIEREARAIDADTDKLTDVKTQISKSRAERIYLPTTMQLASTQTVNKATYPEYDKLFSGGADPNALTVALVNGRLEHKHVTAVEDGGYFEWMSALDQIFKVHPEFELTKIDPPDQNITVALVGANEIKGLTFKNFIDWTVRDTGWPAGIGNGGRKEIAEKISEKLVNHWVTFEKKVKVSVGNAPPRDFTLRIETSFGADEDPEPHQRAVKRGDVVVYNGHSYIGYGPLDPDNFKSSSFSPGYQLFFFDSCVSYNYYEKDFFSLKRGGSESLDIITNGLEAPEEDSGLAEGKFIAKLLDGSMPSYQTLLTTAKRTDSMRVVDGELDNKFRPNKVSVRVTSR